jgi:hypothetical protein
MSPLETLVVSRGTDGSNPVSSSEESAANSVQDQASAGEEESRSPERPRVPLGPRVRIRLPPAVSPLRT